jgi:hypothetical protein
MLLMSASKATTSNADTPATPSMVASHPLPSAGLLLESPPTLHPS